MRPALPTLHPFPHGLGPQLGPGAAPWVLPSLELQAHVLPYLPSLCLTATRLLNFPSSPAILAALQKVPSLASPKDNCINPFHARDDSISVLQRIRGNKDNRGDVELTEVPISGISELQVQIPFSEVSTEVPPVCIPARGTHKTSPL